jgi:spore coat protein U-like protein
MHFKERVMSKFAVRALFAATLALAASAGFSAQEARSLSVTASIAGACTLTTSGPMAFGNLDMTSTAAETKQVTATYKCSLGFNVPANGFTVGGLTTGAFSGTMASITTGNTDSINYSITWSQPGAYTGAGFAVAGQQVVLTGTIPNANYIGKATGSYADSVVIAVNY